MMTTQAHPHVDKWSWAFAAATAALFAACLVPDVELVHDREGSSGSAGARTAASGTGNGALGGDAMSQTGNAGNQASGGSPSRGW